MIHELKTWPAYFNEVLKGSKNFEVRKDDRNYQKEDILILKEYDYENNQFTGRRLVRDVTYVLKGGVFGIESGYCVISIKQADWLGN